MPSSSILEKYPEYADTAVLDQLRASEYGYLDEQGHVYLDYTGAGLAARSQHRAHASREAACVLGNPHSASLPSEAATRLVEQTRERVLQFFHASPDEYAVIFTPNATGAARLVGEAYRFGGSGSGSGSGSGRSHSGRGRSVRSGRGKRFVLTADNHNSINGLREYARRAGCPTVYVPSRPGNLTVDPAVLDAALPGPPRRTRFRTRLRRKISKWLCGGSSYDEDDGKDHGNEGAAVPLPFDPHHDHHNGLFAYPAQSNFSGVRHPLAWVHWAQARGYDVLLDAAAYVPTSPLDLSAVHPDFVTVSWYKLFGYPTGVGCLIARRAALDRLDRPWFSGGTIQAASVGLDWHADAARPEPRFEDGTVNFHAIPDVHTGLDWLDGLMGAGQAEDEDKEGGPNGAEEEEEKEENDGQPLSRQQPIKPLSTPLLPLVQARTACLTGWFLDRLLALRHSNGRPMVVLYGPPSSSSSKDPAAQRGATVTFNLVDPAGRFHDERIVGAEAAAARISLRSGCFCNPGAGETALALSWTDLKLFQALASTASWGGRSSRGSTGSGTSSGRSSESMTVSEKGFAHAVTTAALEKAIATIVGGGDFPLAGAIRVSFGIASNTADVDSFFAFAEAAFRDRVADNSQMGPRREC